MRTIQFVLFFLVSGAFLQDVTAQVSSGNSSKSWFEVFTKQNERYSATGAYRPLTDVFDDSHAFFLQPTFIKGDIHYLGTTQLDARLIYDINQDQVFIQHPDSGLPFMASSSAVEWFIIQDHYFERVAGQEGYFELAQSSDSFRLYKKYRVGKVREYDEDIGYIVDAQYFLANEDLWNRLKNRKSLYKLFPQLKTELKQYYKELKRANREIDKETELLMLSAFLEGKVKQ